MFEKLRCLSAEGVKSMCGFVRRHVKIREKTKTELRLLHFIESQPSGKVTTMTPRLIQRILRRGITNYVHLSLRFNSMITFYSLENLQIKIWNRSICN